MWARVTRVETSLIFSLMKDEFVPVIAPVGVNDERSTPNINADAVARAVAGALRAAADHADGRGLACLTRRQAHPVHPREGTLRACTGNAAAVTAA